MMPSVTVYVCVVDSDVRKNNGEQILMVMMFSEWITLSRGFLAGYLLELF